LKKTYAKKIRVTTPFSSVTEEHAAVIINPRRSLAPHQTELTEFTYEEHVVLFNQQPEFQPHQKQREPHCLFQYFATRENFRAILWKRENKQGFKGTVSRDFLDSIFFINLLLLVLLEVP
jgi:hypothetical protein